MSEANTNWRTLGGIDPAWLLAFAQQNPPPPEWFEEDFTVALGMEPNDNYGRSPIEDAMIDFMRHEDARRGRIRALTQTADLEGRREEGRR